MANHNEWQVAISFSVDELAVLKQLIQIGAVEFDFGETAKTIHQKVEDAIRNFGSRAER